MPARYYGYKKPSTANAKPATTPSIVATGQWEAGKLSGLETTKGVTESQATKNVTHFTDLGGGKTGSLVDKPVTDLNQQTPAFAAKAQQALAQEALSQQQVMPQGASGAQAPAASLLAPNTNNPFAPNFSGTPPQTGFEQTAGAEGRGEVIHANPPNAFSTENLMGAATMLSAGGAEIGLGIATQAISYIVGLGGGSWLAGIKSLMPTGTRGALAGSTDDWVYSSLKESMTGVVTKDAAKGAANVKSMSTIKTMVSKWFTQDKITAYVTESGRLRYKVLKVSTLTPTNVLKAVGVAGGVASLATWLVVNGKQSQTMGKWAVNEDATTYLTIQASAMYKDGNRELGDLFMDMAVDATNTSISALPGGRGTQQGLGILQDVFNKTAPLVKEHYAQMEEMETAGNTPETNAQFWTDYHAQVEANKTAEENARVDYYNSERLRVETEIANARAKNNSSERAADKKAAADLAAFWLDYQKKLAAMEEEQMRKSAEYWLNYRKLIMKMQEETGRSRLGFGLFR